ncbi:MAG: HlyD family efflux transporter periplasmic adaptor subunit [Patescibacteria group bacterium]|nr:HlyD family efflux transporter periplasmic adaptor subunit [Patescibacteria group bacterium]
MKNLLKKILKNKKYLFISIIILGIVWIGYVKFFNNSNQTKYVLGIVQKGKIEISVSGAGFVLPTKQIDLKSKVSGDVVYIPVKEGDRVRAGDLIIKFDTSNAEKNVRDAEINLENAKLILEKLKKQYDDALRADTLNKNYEDGISILTEFYNDYPNILNGLNNILFNRDFYFDNLTNIEYYASYDKKFQNLPNLTKNLYDKLKDDYNQSFNDYNLAKRGSGSERARAIQEGYNLISETSQLIKIAQDAILSLQGQIIINNAVHKYQSIINSHASSLNNYFNKIDSYLKNILVIVNNINNFNDNISNYPLDIKAQELNVLAKQNALNDAKEKLADYYIRAPFSGIVTNINVKVGDTISGGVLASLITEDKIAEISLNEIDAAQVKVGQNAILTFDALPDVSLNGRVLEISTIGTESQGVVSYNVKINFEDKNDNVKPGMSVTAKIITNSKDNVLLIPNSAIKIFNQDKYVEKPIEKLSENIIKASMRSGIILSTTTRQIIKTGLSNDEFSEIIDGLNEGDIIILRIINLNNSQASSNVSNQRQTSQSSAIFRFPGTSGRAR